MSFDKAIEHGKEHRKRYYGSKSIDASCRSHGDCPHCQDNRKHKIKRQKPIDESYDRWLDDYWNDPEYYDEGWLDEFKGDIPHGTL